MLGIYVHIPFCERKCIYCAFSSFVKGFEERKRYVSALIKEIENFHKSHKEEKYRTVNSVYFGGGTPSLLEEELFCDIFKTIKENFILTDDCEITVECNPNSLTEEKLSLYKKEGVNRLSIGVQSLDDEKLKFIGRVHDKNMAEEKLKLAKQYFDNISCDMLIGLKGMEIEALKEELSVLIELGAKHISTYMLQIEEGTPLQKLVIENPSLLPNEDECAFAYEEVVKYLSERGLKQYEVSNFAVKGYESKHNVKYWTGEEYAGFGLSAHSLIGNTRYSNADRLTDYYEGKRSLFEKLGQRELIEEHIMLGLRCKMGIDLSYLASLGCKLEQNKSYIDYLEKGILYKASDDENRVYLNSKYYSVNNFIITSLMPEK